MAKTKAELEVEIRELKAQLSEQSKVEQFDKCATDMRNVYESYINAGFTEKEAWEIFITQVSGAAQPKRSLF